MGRIWKDELLSRGCVGRKVPVWETSTHLQGVVGSGREGAEAEKGKVGPVRGRLAQLSRPRSLSFQAYLRRVPSDNLSQPRPLCMRVPLPGSPCGSLPGERPRILHEVLSESAERVFLRACPPETRAVAPTGLCTASHPQKRTQSRRCPGEWVNQAH